MWVFFGAKIPEFTLLTSSVNGQAKSLFQNLENFDLCKFCSSRLQETSLSKQCPCGPLSWAYYVRFLLPRFSSLPPAHNFLTLPNLVTHCAQLFQTCVCSHSKVLCRGKLQSYLLKGVICMHPHLQEVGLPVQKWGQSRGV